MDGISFNVDLHGWALFYSGNEAGLVLPCILHKNLFHILNVYSALLSIRLLRVCSHWAAVLYLSRLTLTMGIASVVRASPLTPVSLAMPLGSWDRET